MNFDLEFEKTETLTKLTNLLKLADDLSSEGQGEKFLGWHKLVHNFLKEAFTDNNIAAYFENESEMSVSHSYIGEPESVDYYDLPKAKKALRLFLKQLTGPQKVVSTSETSSISTTQIFVVHGHDEALREKVSSTLKRLGLDPIVLNEKANQGMSILEKIERHSEVGFAVVIFSSDDLGASKSEHTLANYEERPRQNVLLELGYFWGKLGRNRVCLLNGIGDALTSDLRGLGYTSTQNGETWKLELARELKAAGYKIDANDLI